ncbi:hypothetical protein AGMMS4952_06860 [Spirochaetia bacterium]|nr:hypothetical protein AGMMS4952_06860 [Spirochaetia bacterium]
MKRLYILSGFFICSAWLLVLSGCVSLAEMGGRVLDGSAFAEKTLARYREEPKRGTRVDRLRRRKDKAEFITIRIDSLPNLRLKGSLPDSEGNFYLTSLYFLSPNMNGWNEFTQELSGSGSFDGAILQLNGPVETLDISEGKIRRGETRLTGAQALTALHNRQERIVALAQWMNQTLVHEQPDIPKFADQKAFEAYWKPRLFPEIVRAKKRPSTWIATPVSSPGAWVFGEDIRWNRAYTEAVFPEELWPVRNSGTLLRDWEEAAGWIYLEFEWDHILELLSEKIELTKIK